MKRLVQVLFIVSLALWSLSLFRIHRLPPPGEVRDELLVEPLQGPTDAPPFSVAKEGIVYTVSPTRTYDHRGLVVALHHSGSFFDVSHEEWQDYLNIKDISTIWGRNIEAGDYRHVKFSHGDWTGCYRYDRPGGFRGDCFANNHLLTADPVLEKEIMRTRVGDQVHMTGWLVDYSHSGGRFRRTSSTRRDDTGNGACETVFVTGYRILKEGNTGWRALHRLSRFVALASLLCLAALFVIGPPLPSGDAGEAR